MPASTSYVLTLEDSEVSSLQLIAGRCSVHFPAVVAVQAAVDGATTTGHALGVQIVLGGAALQRGDLTGLGRLRRGEITVDGAVLQSLQPGGAWHGSVVMQLEFANGTTCSLSATTLACAFTGDARFVESYAC